VGGGSFGRGGFGSRQCLEPLAGRDPADRNLEAVVRVEDVSQGLREVDCTGRLVGRVGAEALGREEGVGCEDLDVIDGLEIVEDRNREGCCEGECMERRQPWPRRRLWT